ncbi:unnamed protein product [Phyllotreta striolata]|uniref:SAM domain-containing protein n=1 Tax=Phyllotreta striolata TaxID=444603 RepID=A0A9N9TN85_PHYSR|nr:unnamed protein product [Phyllotreta striolata]
MACSNLPNRVLGFNNKTSDTLSEVSEGTVTSDWPANWDTKEDLKEFLAKLGLKDVADLYQERFRIDRRKLEQMLTGGNDALVPADVFFAKVMEDTDTYITWPNKLKIGAKSKKDPHVRIAGRPEDVKAARDRVKILLDTKCNRITMKMDVSYTDHSHIIGKGGLTIKRVMEETQCHVHFPDSNRSSLIDKSNQVSISGDIRGAENARSRVRQLIPLIFGFELPIMTQNVDATSYIANIQEKYHVQVIFKTRPKLHATLVLVKGQEWEADQVKRATILLMEFMCENLANQIPVQMSMEISPHHHPIVLGKNHTNLKLIMKFTNCRIMFPDAQDPNIPNLKKSNVNISGNIHDVYKARQLLMGSLPLIVIFDLPEEYSMLRKEQIDQVQNNYDVTITIRQKAKNNTKACIIKGVEKNAENIYKARNYILGLDELYVQADIPSSYHLPWAKGEANSHSPQNTSEDSSPPASAWRLPLATSQQSEASYAGAMHQQPSFNCQQQQQHTVGSSGYHSLSYNQMTSSLVDSDQNSDVELHSPVYSAHNSTSSSSISYPRASPSPSPRHSGNKNDFSAMLSNMNFSPGYHGPSVDRRQDSFNLSPDEAQSKRLAGFRAMQEKPTGATYRRPVNSWSGYYISHTSPAPLFETPKRKHQDDEVWSSSPKSYCNTPNAALHTSNILDHTPNTLLKNLATLDCEDLSGVLSSIGLDRYISLFAKNEIDLALFCTLNDKDLFEIGVSTFGARKKMLLTITELNKRSNNFLAAPGAERRVKPLESGSPNFSSPSEKW